jgi:2-polyprenyl-3-methyl-5-hydroxy-6-metoxy-1,4-benzoquinol methylase
MRDALSALSRRVWEPAGKELPDRLRLLEAKVEYLLNEVYRVKALQRLGPDAINTLAGLRSYQVKSFEFQWDRIVYHDEFLSNAEWMAKAPLDVSARLGVAGPEFFAGKKILDCGCGPGRHAFTFGRLGAAEVVAFDLGDKTLEAASKACTGMANVIIEKRNIVEPLPYAKDFDVVWCYGVLHHTGDMLGSLKNIARHVKPGGLIYLMLYAEPRRDNIFDYQYQHEVATIRDATRALPFAQKAEALEQIDGKQHTLAWFDAISSEINDLYTFEEIRLHLEALGFEAVRRTMPHETMHNVVATRGA